MADQPNHPADNAAAAGAAEPDNRVPYERFKATNDARRSAEEKLAEATERLQAHEDAQRSESEKLIARAEKAEKAAAELERRTVNLERGSWVRAAAEKARFHDSADAISRADLAAMESEADAAAFVKGLAKTSPHLVAKEAPRPNVERVLKDGQRVEETSEEEGGTVSESDSDFLSQIRRSQDRQDWSSVPFG